MSIIKYDIEVIFVNMFRKYAKYSNGAAVKKEKCWELNVTNERGLKN
jgi:hypothetical protein